MELDWARATIKCGYLFRMRCDADEAHHLLARPLHRVFRNVKLIAAYMAFTKLMGNWNENTEYRSNEFSDFVAYIGP